MSNSLAGETSPYLRQHADNPVDWLPWGPEALQRARTQGKPILLSIGYSACHWCHVMAHESFEDEAIARLMNELYVNIKVDREERPDLDRIYQLAQQMLTGRGGGWPLTMFLLPDDQRPFFGGTYFPPQARHGLPAFGDLLTHVAKYHREHAAALSEAAGAVTTALQGVSAVVKSAATLDDAPLRSCRRQLQRLFDTEWGGFGSAPKFPHPNFIERLLRDWHATASDDEPDLQALYMATLTLKRMADGGIFDQLGGGFCRYSVDERWEIPHFEKMLYDNAQLLAIYAQAACTTGEPLFREVAQRTADWMLAEMRAPDGGFFSSLDADSEGHEGKYYVWQRDQVKRTLSEPEYAAFAPRFGLDAVPNFEGDWHLRVIDNGQEAPAEAVALIESARGRLLAERATRVRPGCDDKRLTSWNALTIRALAIAARALARDDYAAAARQALDFLRQRHWRNGRLLATSAGAEARGNAYLDDYAFLADACLELCTVRFDMDLLNFGVALLEVLVEHFADPETGGFWFTADDHEQLISRSRTFTDEALPAGNGVAAVCLQRYGYLLGESRYLSAAEDCLRAAWEGLSEQSAHHATLLTALEEYLAPPELVILRGTAAGIESWRRQLAAIYAPRRLVLAIAADLTDLPPALASKAPRDQPVAYLCRGMTCSEPITSLSLLSAALISHPAA